MTDKEKEALSLMIESVIKPDHELRDLAKERGCYQELMKYRDKILKVLHE